MTAGSPAVAAGVDWAALQALARKLAKPGAGPGSVPETGWRTLEATFAQFLAVQDWESVLGLRDMFSALYARDTIGGHPLLQRLDAAAIDAAERLGHRSRLAHLLGARGHNLHRQGHHRESIAAFERSAQLYRALEQPFEALQNYYMTALCHRALGDRETARQVLATVLQQVGADDPWRGNPLQVCAWLEQDIGRLDVAEQLLREALALQRRTAEPDILLAGTLADLGEVVGLQGRLRKAEGFFRESLSILDRHKGQYDRQEARTNLKYAELLLRQGAHRQALQRLDRADDLIRGYGGYYDLLWRIELVRAFVFLRQGKVRGALRKFRVAVRVRRELHLSAWMFLKQLATRYFRGTGLPR